MRMRMFGCADGEDVGVGVGEAEVRGVLNAPVDCFWSFSKSSCSSFGRRGGAGPDLKEEAYARRVVLM